MDISDKILKRMDGNTKDLKGRNKKGNLIINNTTMLSQEKRKPGENFLHTHPATENKLGVDPDHVIVDRDEWEESIRLLNLFVSPGALIVAEERCRQITNEGYSYEHDDAHTNFELPHVAALYAYNPKKRYKDKWYLSSVFQALWPEDWDPSHWKPNFTDRVAELRKAGGLIIAEIDRILRTKK